MTFSLGLKNGLPIGLGYFAVSFSFGIAGAKFLEWYLMPLISMTNLTSAGQFMGLRIMQTGGSVLELAIATFFINSRYCLMGVSLSQKVDSGFTTKKRLLLSTGITDEIYALAIGAPRKVSASYFAGLMALPYFGWFLGTLCGALCGEILPRVLTNALGIALYGMFIAIVVPELKKARSVQVAVLLSVLMSLAFHFIPYKISVGFAVILCAVIASLIAACFFPVRENHET